MNINNDSISMPMSDVIQPLLRYNIDTKLRTREYTTTPCYPDQSFNYADLVGTNRNPLAPYSDSIDGTAIPRGGFPFTVIAGTNAAVTPSTGGTAATAVVDMFCTEPLFLSPNYWGCACDDKQGYYNANSMDFNFSFLAQAGFRMWSHANQVSSGGAGIFVTSVINSITVQFNGFTAPAFSYPQSIPQLLFKYISPAILTPQRLSPLRPVTYPFFNVQRYPTDIGAVSYGVSPVPIQSNNIQLSSIPRRIYLYIRPNNATLQSRCDIPDAYLTINNVAIQWANQNTLLSSASQIQLYEINVKNHSSQDWMSWSGIGLNNSGLPPATIASQFGGVGSILALEFATDLQLDGDEAPGLAGQYQLQVQLSVSNLNSSGAWNSLPMTFYVVTVEEGTFTITSAGSAQHQQSVLSKADILNAQGQPGLNYRSVERLNGGDFLGSLRDFGSKVNDFLKNTKLLSTVGKAVGTVFGPAGVAGDIADKLGYGAGCDGGNMGGMRLTKAELQSRL